MVLPRRYLLVESQQKKHYNKRKICSKLTIKTPEWYDVLMVSLLLTLNSALSSVTF